MTEQRNPAEAEDKQQSLDIMATLSTSSTTRNAFLASIGAGEESAMKEGVPDSMFSPAVQQQLQQTTPRDLAFSPSALVSPTATKEGSNPPSKESSPDGTASNTSGTVRGEVKETERGVDGIDRLFVAGIGCMKSQTAAYIDKQQGDDVVLAKTGVVKLTHNGKDAMVVLPSEATSELATTVEMSETLQKALGVKEEIVGLQTNAVVLDEESEGAIFKHHGQAVVPFSALCSGQLHSLLRASTGLEGLPSFELITTNFTNFDSYQMSSEATSASLSIASSTRSSAEHEVHQSDDRDLYAQAFIDCIESDDLFSDLEKDVLLKFGAENAETGNLLYRAAFRIAVFTERMSYFVDSLHSIAKVLLKNKVSSSSFVDASTTLTLFGLTEFIVVADELFASEQISPSEYATLLNAIFSGQEDVGVLFDLYSNPDFALACDESGEEHARTRLCFRDLKHLAKKLEPIVTTPDYNNYASPDYNDKLKWALKLGLHNFFGSLDDVPRQFGSIIHHMFLSGDDMVRAAAHNFVQTSDNSLMEEMLTREWEIYTKSVREEELVDHTTLVLDAHKDSSAESTNYREIPDTLLTACTLLIDRNEISEDSAATVVASYAKGDALVNGVQDYYIESGNTDEYLSMLCILAKHSDGTDGSKGMEGSGEKADSTTSSAHSSDLFLSDDLLKAVVQSLEKDDLFGSVEIASLRLASIRDDPVLSQAILDFMESRDVNRFKADLLLVADAVGLDE